MLFRASLRESLPGENSALLRLTPSVNVFEGGGAAGQTGSLTGSASDELLFVGAPTWTIREAHGLGAIQVGVAK